MTCLEPKPSGFRRKKAAHCAPSIHSSPAGTGRFWPRNAAGKPYALLFFLPLLLGASAALAHSTIVFGVLTPEPNPPLADSPFRLELELVDPTSVPVEDAFVLAEFRLDGEEVGSVRFEEGQLPGMYVAEVELPEAGTYLVTMRDQTFRQEEAVTEIQLPVGANEAAEPVEFVFPPTAVGGSLTTWLIWLVGVPLIAGAVVTLLVLRAGPPEGTASKERE